MRKVFNIPVHSGGVNSSRGRGNEDVFDIVGLGSRSKGYMREGIMGRQFLLEQTQNQCKMTKTSSLRNLPTARETFVR